MPITALAIHFLGGMFLANSIPHTVHGISGHRFQTPFSRPRGVGESSPIVNVLWGVFNIALGWHLVHLHRGPGVRTHEDVAAMTLGALIVALGLAWWFGKVRGTPMAPGDSLGH